MSHTCIDHKEHLHLLLWLRFFAWQILVVGGGEEKLAGWLAGRWFTFFLGGGVRVLGGSS